MSDDPTNSPRWDEVAAVFVAVFAFLAWVAMCQVTWDMATRGR